MGGPCEPPPGIVDMVIPYEGSDYDSDTEYIASCSSSFSDVTSAELIGCSYDLLENQVSCSLPTSRRTSLIPPEQRKGSLMPNFLTAAEQLPIDESLQNFLKKGARDQNGEPEIMAHIHVSACYQYKQRTLYVQLRTLVTLGSTFDANVQVTRQLSFE